MIKIESRVFNIIVLLIVHQLISTLSIINRTSSTPRIKFQIYLNLALLLLIIFILYQVISRLIRMTKDELVIKLEHQIGLSLVTVVQFILASAFIYITFKSMNLTLGLSSFLLSLLFIKNIIVLLTYYGVSDTNIYNKGTQIDFRNVTSFERGEKDIYVTVSKKILCFNICDVLCVNIEGNQQDMFAEISSKYKIKENHNVLCKTKLG